MLYQSQFGIWLATNDIENLFWEFKLSTKGIFTAVSGAVAQSEKLDTIANNMANVNTPAYKKDQQVFQEYLTSYEKQQDVIEAPKVPAEIESFYNMNGGDKSYVDVAGTYVNFRQGQMKPTNNKLDVGVEGKGFFEVLTPQGVRYTRNGALTFDQQGTLTTKQGYPILSQGTGDPQGRQLRLEVGEDFQITPDGDVYQNQNLIGRLSVVEFGNRQALRKQGASLYSVTNTVATTITPSNEYRLHQGYLEASNVNIVQEMTDMLQTTRTFESTQKAIQAYDKMEQLLVNEIPKL